MSFLPEKIRTYFPKDRKIYKSPNYICINILLGDLKGLPDDCVISLIFGGFS